MRFEKSTILTAFFKSQFLKTQFPNIYVLRFDLKSHLLSTKSQSQTHPKSVLHFKSALIGDQ
jgi:hypothetical protein